MLKDISDSEREESAFRKNEVQKEIFHGDDLSKKDLDDLYDYLNTNKESHIANWYKDKPHQIVLRLLKRLTRVEIFINQNCVEQFDEWKNSK